MTLELVHKLYDLPGLKRGPEKLVILDVKGQELTMTSIAQLERYHRALTMMMQETWAKVELFRQDMAKKTDEIRERIFVCDICKTPRSTCPHH